MNKMYKEILEYYYNKDEYFLRVRDNQVIVYFNGRKVLSYIISNNVLEVSLAQFLPNSKNSEENIISVIDMDKGFGNNIIIPEQVVKDFDSLCNMGFKFNVSKQVTLAKSSSDEGKKVGIDQAKKIFEKLKILDLSYGNVSESNEKYAVMLDNVEQIDFSKFFKAKLVCYAFSGFEKKPIYDENKECWVLNTESNKSTGFQTMSITANLNCTDFTKIDLDELTKIMKRRIQIYDNLLDDKDRTKELGNTEVCDGEKQFQQDLMIKMKNKDTREELAKTEGFPFSKDDIPFEMEATLYASNKPTFSLEEIDDEEENTEILENDNEGKRQRNNKKGRIDNIFVNFKENKIRLVELKLDTKAIGGTNGIHKHLLDLLTCLDKNKTLKREIIDVIDNKYKILKQYGMDISEYKELNLDEVNIEYLIICGYSNSKKEVIDALNLIKDKTILDIESFTLKVDSKLSKGFDEFIKNLKTENQDNSSNQYEKELLTYNINDYINELDSKYDCKVKIIVCDRNYTCFIFNKTPK